MHNLSADDAVRKINEYLRNPYQTLPLLIEADGSADYKSILGRITLKRIRASSFCNEDSFINCDELIRELGNSNEDTVILGAGDTYLLCGDNLFEHIAGIQSKCKIVALCRGSRQILERMAERDPKMREGRILFVADSHLDYSIKKAYSGYTAKEGERTAVGFRKLLQELENGIYGEITVKTRLPIKSAIREISDPYEEAKDKTDGLSIPKDALDMEMWQAFAKNPEEESEDPSHWRTYIKILMQGSENSYLEKAAKTSETFRNYRSRIISALLDEDRHSPEFHNLKKEREKVLRETGISEEEISSYIINSRKIRGFDRIYYFSDSLKEKREIIRAISQEQIIPVDLREIYPDLAAYISEYNIQECQESVISEYFHQYRIQKLLNKIDGNFIKKVESFASGKKPYNSLQTRSSITERKNDMETLLVWIDALGAEYAEFITLKAASLGMEAETEIGRASFPTLTSENREFYSEWHEGLKRYTKTLDDIKHGRKGMSPDDEGLPLYIADELDAISSELKKIRNELSSGKYKSAVIASDHGASRLAVISPKEYRWEMAEKGIHSGRCCRKSDTDNKPEKAVEGAGFWSLANYDMFKGGRQAVCEVHGGASLEETAVPIIRLSLISPADRIEADIQTEKIELDAIGNKAEAVIYVNRNIGTVELKISGAKTSHIGKIDAYHHKFLIENTDTGIHNAQIFAYGRKIRETDIMIGKKTIARCNKKQEDFFS